MLGTGTYENPYLVSTEDDLNDIRLNPTKCYKLTNDIYLTKWQTGEGWTPIPVFGAYSNGQDENEAYIDGDGFTVHDLYINRGSQPSIGFISFLDNGNVKNINFKDVNIVGGNSTGVIAGRGRGVELILYGTTYITYHAKISNCIISGEIRGTDNIVGGIIGKSEVYTASGEDVGVIVEDCHVDVNIYGNKTLGGIAGRDVHTTRCSTKGNIFGESRIGGLVGESKQGHVSVRSCYSIMTLSGNYIGGIFGYITYNSTGDNFNNTLINSYFAGRMNFNENSSSTHVGVITSSGSAYNSGFLYDSTKLNLDQTKLYNIHGTSDMTLLPKNSSEMSNPMTYFKNGFKPSDFIFMEDGTSTTDTMQIKSEIPNHPINQPLSGSGTNADPYLIQTFWDFYKMEDYDYKNWQDYRVQFQDENNWNSPNFKTNYNFSSPPQYVYKMTNDIDLNVYPLNTIGWFSIFRTEDLTSIRSELTTYNLLRFPLWANTYNSIGQITGLRAVPSGRTPKESDYIRLPNGDIFKSSGTATSNTFIHRGFLGILDGNGFKIKNLKLKEFPNYPELGFMGTISGGTIRDLTFDNVLVELDKYHSDSNQPANSPNANQGIVSVGIVSNKLQGTSKLERVSVNGNTFIKDYRADVYDHKREIAGLVHSTLELDTGAEEENSSPTRMSIIKDCAVRLNHTFTNVDPSDAIATGFYAITKNLYYCNILNTYSASSSSRVDRFNMPVSGISAGMPFTNYVTYLIRSVNGVSTYFPSGSIVGGYFDSTISNMNWNGVSAHNFLTSYTMSVNSRSTEAMKLPSTYTGWDFDRTWQADGINYPTLQPFDPNYVEPSNSTEHILTTQLDPIETITVKESKQRLWETRVVKSASRKFEGDKMTTRKGGSSVKTQLEPLHVIAFEYKEPVIGVRSISTNVEPLEMQSQSSISRAREMSLLTSLGDLETGVEAIGVNRGIFFDGITIERIDFKSMLIKVNDPRIESILFSSGSYIIPSTRYINLVIDSSLLSEGDNLLSIEGIATVEEIDGNGYPTGQMVEEVLYTKNVNVNKKTPSYESRAGDYVILNDEYYTVLNHTPDNILTLDRNLSSNLPRFLGNYEMMFDESGNLIESGISNNPFNTIEMLENKSITKISAGGRYHEPVFTEGTFIKARRSGDFVEEEYEFELEGSEVVTEMEFTRPVLNNFATTDLSKNYFDAWHTNFNYEIAQIEGIKDADGNFYTTYGVSGERAVQIFRVEMIDFVEQNLFEIDKKYRNEKKQWIIDNFGSMTINWKGFTNIKNSTGGSRIRPATISYASSRNPMVWTDIGVSPDANMSSFTVTNTDLVSHNRDHNNTLQLENAYVYFKITSDLPTVGEQDTGWSPYLDTDYISFDIDMDIVAPEAEVLSEVRQVFIPKENNNRDL